MRPRFLLYPSRLALLALLILASTVPASADRLEHRRIDWGIDRLYCPDNLYLDGDMSYVYIRGETPTIRETNHFAGILAVTTPAP